MNNTNINNAIANKTITIATIVIVLLNVFMWFSQIAMLDINPGGTQCYTPEGSIIEGVQSGSTTLANIDPLTNLPDPTDSNVQPTASGGQGTDLFSNILAWIKQVPGLGYLIDVVSAPYNILKCMGLPDQVVAGLGTLWYLISFLVFLTFIWWRD